MRAHWEHVRDRLGSGVRRCHVKRTIQTNTIGEHSWGVAMLCVRLYPECSADLLKAALVHDLAEYETGDMPANVKWINPRAAAELKMVEQRVDDAQGYTFHQRLDPLEAKVLHFCDILDLAWFCAVEHRMGNTLADDVFSRAIFACYERAKLVDPISDIALNMVDEVVNYFNQKDSDEIHDTTYHLPPKE